MATETEIKFIGAKDVAKVANVAEGTVRWWAHVGRGPRRYRAPGTRRVLYRLDEVFDWIESGAMDTAHEASEKA